MIKSIYLENFMSHRASLMELAPGVTVITGPNNVGKSAVVEAVRSLVQNPSQKFSIRHGARRAVVRLELDSGEIIEWVRTDKTPYYLLIRPQGREEYRKIGLSVPEDIRALLRLGRVETESGDLDIHIGNQREPIFLLNSPGSQAAGFFAASSEAEYLLRMRQALKRRVDYAKTNRKRLEVRCQVQEEALRRYQPLDGLEPELERAEQTYELICEQQKSLPALSGVIEDLAEKEGIFSKLQQSAGFLGRLEHPPGLQEIDGLKELLRHWQQIAGKSELAAASFMVLKPLSSHPSLEETASLGQLVGRLAETDRLLKQSREEKASLLELAEPSALSPVVDLKRLIEALQGHDMALAANQSRGGVLQDIQEPPEIHDLSPLEQLLSEMQAREELRKRARQRQEILAGLTGPAALSDVVDLLQLMAGLLGLQTRKRHLEGLGGTLAGLAPAPVIAPVTELEKLIEQTAGVMERIGRQQEEKDTLETALEQKRREVEELIRATGLCPLCGSPMEVGRFLEGGHG